MNNAHGQASAYTNRNSSGYNVLRSYGNTLRNRSSMWSLLNESFTEQSDPVPHQQTQHSSTYADDNNNDNYDYQQFHSEDVNFVTESIIYNSSDVIEEIDVQQRETIYNLLGKHFNFNLWNSILNYLVKLNSSFSSNYPADHHQPMCIYSPLTNKGTFCQDIISVAAADKISDNQLLSLFRVLTASFPFINWPLKGVVVKGELNSNTLTIRKYSNQVVSNYIQFDLCSRFNCPGIFAGIKLGSKVRCHVCNLPRFTKCSQTSCQGKQYDLCSHDFKYRTPILSVYYRSITSIISELLHMKEFISYLNYVYINNTNLSYMDVQDGSSFKSNVKQMEKQYMDKYSKLQSKPIMVNILLSLFYDGIQISKSKQENRDSFWPIFITILNLPPTFRNRLGIGMHLINIFSGKIGSCVENFIMRDLLTQELLKLNEGIELEINEVKYYIQVRLVGVILDTIAVQDVLHIQTTNSYAGCGLCDSGTGIRRTGLKTVVYPGHRCLLPLLHQLRFYGQSKQCCPEIYYENKNINTSKTNKEKKKRKIGDFESDEEIDISQVEKVIYQDCKSNGGDSSVKRIFTAEEFYLSNPCCGEFSRQHIAALLPSCNTSRNNNSKGVRNVLTKTNPFIWFHNRLAFQFFKDDFYFSHCDFREEKTRFRKSNLFYVENAKTAKNSKPPVSNGVKGLWPFAMLPYIDISKSVCWDPFHAMSNVAKNIISNMKSERCDNKPGIKTLCAAMNSHPYLYTNSPLQSSPWSLSEKLQKEVELVLDCLLIPVGYSNKLQVKKIFSLTGYLNGVESIHVFAILINFITVLTNRELPQSYCMFYRMIGEDFNLLMSMGFSDDPNNERNIDNIYNKIVETVAVHEGMFPYSESLIIWHQLIDIPHYIRNFGPVRGFWALPGERALGALKEYVPHGGIGLDKTTLTQFTSFIKHKASFAFDSDTQYVVDNELLKDLNSCIEKTSKQVSQYDGSSREGKSFNFYKTMIVSTTKSKLASERFSIRGSDLIYLLECLLEHIQQICSSVEVALRDSPLYRLYYAFLYHKQNHPNDLKQVEKFNHWILRLNNLADPNPDSNNTQSDFNVFIVRYIRYEEFCNINQNLIQEGIIFCNDLQIIKYLLNEVFAISEKAIIFGVKMCGRGKMYQEYSEPTRFRPLVYGQEMKKKSHVPSQNLNNLQNWDNKNGKEYSSWIKFSSTQIEYKTLPIVQNLSNRFRQVMKEHETKYEYFGQTNFFFTIDYSGDKILNNLCIASVVSRKNTDELSAWVDTISCSDTSWVEGIRFIPIMQIFPTVFLSCCFDKNEHKPIQLTENVISDTSYIVLIPLFPWQMHMMYEWLNYKQIH